MCRKVEIAEAARSVTTISAAQTRAYRELSASVNIRRCSIAVAHCGTGGALHTFALIHPVGIARGMILLMATD